MTKKKSDLIARVLIFIVVGYIFLLFFTAGTALATKVNGQRCYNTTIHYNFRIDLSGCKK